MATDLLLPQKGHSPQFSAHICCGQMAAWIKMLLGMELGLSPGDFVLDGDPALRPKFSAHVYYSYCDFVRTSHSAQSLFVCSSSSILCILFLEKSLIVLSLFRYAQLHHTAPIAEVGVAN